MSTVVNTIDIQGKKMGLPRTKTGKSKIQITFHLSGIIGFLLPLLLFANPHCSYSEDWLFLFTRQITKGHKAQSLSSLDLSAQ